MMLLKSMKLFLSIKSKVADKINPTTTTLKPVKALLIYLLSLNFRKNLLNIIIIIIEGVINPNVATVAPITSPVTR